MTCKDCIHFCVCDNFCLVDYKPCNKGFQNKADWQEVKHGEWIGCDYDKCSICGGFELGRTDYCPNCGARMDGDIDGE